MTVRAIYNGRQIVPQDQAAIATWKAKLKTGETVLLTFETAERARTRLQQGLLHELLGRYARAMGESLETVKVRTKCDLGHYVPADKVLSGELDMPAWRGRFVDLHEVYPELHGEASIVFLRSEADYTTRMEAEFVDRVMAMCSENGVDIGDIMEQLNG